MKQISDNTPKQGGQIGSFHKTLKQGILGQIISKTIRMHNLQSGMYLYSITITEYTPKIFDTMRISFNIKPATKNYLTG